MATTCTRCEGTGFLNLSQIEEITGVALLDTGGLDAVSEWIKANGGHDVQICDCCGDGYGWYGYPGEHYNNEDQPGGDGPYSYNGGYCECH